MGKPDALGIKIAAQMPCPPLPGLTNETLCNVIDAPGLDFVTRQAVAVDPPRELTTQAQAKKDADLADGEAMVNLLVIGIMVVTAMLCLFSFLLGLFCCRKARLSARAGGTSAENGQSPTILANGANSGTKAGNAGVAVCVFFHYHAD